jgi:hypothetical protein
VPTAIKCNVTVLSFSNSNFIALSLGQLRSSLIVAVKPKHVAANLASIWPCILIYFYSKTKQMHQCIKFILFWNDTLHVSDSLSVRLQEFKTVHTATGICQTAVAVCTVLNS